MKRQRMIGCYRGGLFVLTLLFCVCLVLMALPVPADAQGVSNLRNSIRNITRPVIESVRTVIRPSLSIRRNQAGAVTGLYLNHDGSLLFTVLDDGTARTWDLRRGVQLGDAVGRDIAAGALRDRGLDSEAVVVHRDGSVAAIRPDGSVLRLAEAVEGIDANSVPVISGDGSVAAYRVRGSGWRVRRHGAGQSGSLPNVAAGSRPILSRDGATVVYRTNQGSLVVSDALGGGRRVTEIGRCVRTARLTAGVFMPDGTRLVLGDEKGNICVRSISDREGLQRRLKRRSVKRRSVNGSVQMLTLDRDGTHVAVGGKDTKATVWSIKATEISRQALASLLLAVSPARSMRIDARRKWLLAGEQNGTIGVYSFNDSGRIARLISMDNGWAVVDHKGRFDGPQSGVDVLEWAGETATQTLPLDAFSQGWFEPGLLARLEDLQDDAGTLLTADTRDLSDDGYIAPPAVSIDPIADSANAAGPSLVRVRLAQDYPLADLSEVRLYHNGKLANRTTPPPGSDKRIFEYAIRMSPGENTFRAVGVGPDEIEGQPATATRMVAVSEPRRPRMQVVAVGINDYILPSMELLSARNDAEAIVSALRERGSRQFDDVKATTLLDSLASAPAIVESIARGIPPDKDVLSQDILPQDVLVVYFAAHGYAVQEGGGWEWYLLPYTDAWREMSTASTVQGEETIRRHGISSRKLMTALTTTKAHRVFLILDSCYSGAVVEAVETPEGRAFDDAVGQKALRRLARVGGIHILAAARADEVAFELDAVPHGALTYLVLEGIRGAANKDDDETISVQEIIGYASRQMPLLSQRLEQGSISQKPVGYSRGADFALAGL